MVRHRPGPPRGAPTVEFLAERSAHGDCGVAAIELHPLGRELVEMRRDRFASPGTKRVAVDVVADQHDDVGFLCTGGFGE